MAILVTPLNDEKDWPVLTTVPGVMGIIYKSHRRLLDVNYSDIITGIRSNILTIEETLMIACIQIGTTAPHTRPRIVQFA